MVDQATRGSRSSTAAGNFLLTFGGGVNKTTSADVCTEASGNTCGEGSNGPGEGEFSGTAYVGVGPAGTVYVVDSGSKYRLQRFNPDGTAVAPQQTSTPDRRKLGTAGLAVDSTGAFYVQQRKKVSSSTKRRPGESALRLTKS